MGTQPGLPLLLGLLHKSGHFSGKIAKLVFPYEDLKKVSELEIIKCY